MNIFIKKSTTTNSIQRQISYQAGGQTHFRFYPPLAYIMGMIPGKWNKFDEQLAPYPADIKAGFYHLYCYSEVVRPQLVGNAYAPLLRIVGVEGAYGDVVTKYFNPAYYLPLSKKKK